MCRHKLAPSSHSPFAFAWGVEIRSRSNRHPLGDCPSSIVHAYPPLRRDMTCVGTFLAMPYIVSGRVKLYFEENGCGYPIIFLHEFESDSRAWDSQIQHFARNYRCITYNARGYPPSDVPEELASYGWELSVDDVAAVMRGLSISRAHLVGSSMGGYTALQFGLRHPEKASAIVAAGTGFAGT